MTAYTSVPHPTSFVSSKILRKFMLTDKLFVFFSNCYFHQGNDYILNRFTRASPWREDGEIKTGREHRWGGWRLFGCSSIPGIISYFLIYMVIPQLCSLCVTSSSCILTTCVSPCTYTSILQSLF